MEPKTAALEVLPAQLTNLKECAEQINTYHQGCLDSFANQMGYGFLAGITLSRAKDSLPHGHFAQWCSVYLPLIPERTARRYMSFASRLQDQSIELAELCSDPFLLTNGHFNEAQREGILKTVHDVADGKSLTDLYRDLGVIKQPEKQKYTAPKELTPEEEARAKEEAAEQLAKTIIGDIALVLAEGSPTLGLLTNFTRRDLLNACIDLGKSLRAITKSKPKAKAHRQTSTR